MRPAAPPRRRRPDAGRRQRRRPGRALAVHENCLREARRWPRFADLTAALDERDKDPKAAAAALKGALDHATAAVEAAAQAVAAAAVEKTKTEAADRVEQARGEAAAAAEREATARSEAREKHALAERTVATRNKARQELTERTKEREAWRRYAEHLEAAAVEVVVTADTDGLGYHRDPEHATLDALAAALAFDAKRTGPMIDKRRADKGFRPRRRRG